MAAPQTKSKPGSSARNPAAWLRCNFIAGTTTAVVLIPRSMACAIVAGMPAYHGLYASLSSLLVYTLRTLRTAGDRNGRFSTRCWLERP